MEKRGSTTIDKDNLWASMVGKKPLASVLNYNGFGTISKKNEIQ